MENREFIQAEISKSKTELIKLDTIIFDKSQYSRVDGVDYNAVEDYSHNISTMPPLIINQNNIIINGVHRYKALQRAEQDNANVIRINVPDDEIALAGLILDRDNGVRHPEKDLKRMCIRLFDGTSLTDKHLMSELKIPERTYYRWTQDSRRENQEAVNHNMVMEYLKCEMTQQEIAEGHGYVKSKFTKVKEDIGSIFDNVAEIELLKEYLSEKSLSFLHDALILTPYLLSELL